MDAEALGAIAADNGPAAAHAATALGLRLAGNNGSTIDNDAGITRAPPIACSTRAAMSTHTFGASAESTDEMANSITPSWKIFTRPWRSAIRPARGKNAAVPIRYPDDTNAVVVAATAGNEAVMSSKAIFVAVELNPTSTYPAAPIARAFHASGLMASGLPLAWAESLIDDLAISAMFAYVVLCTKALTRIRPTRWIACTSYKPQPG